MACTRLYFAAAAERRGNWRRRRNGAKDDSRTGRDYSVAGAVSLRFGRCPLGKRQAILSAPPGISNTFVARQFARYFAGQRLDQPQGTFDVLYMHANWAYEDFFEGIKPTSKDGALAFEPRRVSSWSGSPNEMTTVPKARHVLVLDEINRGLTRRLCWAKSCFGAAGVPRDNGATAVGCTSAFRYNLFIIGTMNSRRSLHRSPGLVLRRRSVVDLHPSQRHA